MRATLDHFEIPVRDLDRLASFLEAVFGWRPEARGASTPSSNASGARYRRLTAAEVRTGALEPPMRVGLYQGSDETLDRPTPVVRLEGETLEACLERVSAAGGRVTLEPRAVGDAGRFARFEDPEGHPWGLWQAKAPAAAPRA